MLPSLVAPASSLLFGVSVSSSCVRALAAAATPSSSAALKQSFGAMAAPTCSQPAASSPAACAGLERTEQPTHRSTPASALLTGTTHSSATASPEPMASGISAAITDTWLLHPSSAPLPILGSSIRSSSIASTSTNTSSSSGILTTVSLRQPLSAATHQPGQSVLSIPRLPFAPAPSKSYLPGSRTKSLVEPSAAGAVGHPTSSRRALFNILSSKPPDSKKWQQRRLVGWTPEQFYLVVSDVEQYHHFVPWCQKSQVIKRISDKSMEAELEVGFQVLVERYTSMVTFERPRLVRSCVNNSLLFHHLNSDWILDPGPAPRTCWLNFKVDFAFNSVMYSNLADLFFSQVVKEMVSAFEGRCAKLYGPSSLLNLHHQPGKTTKGAGSTH